MKVEQKKIQIARIATVYTASDGQNFLNADDCFNHEIDVKRWKRRFINHEAYYFVSSLKEFNELNKTLLEVLRHDIEKDNPDYDLKTHYVTHNVYDKSDFYAQTRPSKFPCFVKYKFDKKKYYPSVDYFTSNIVVSLYKDKISNLYKEAKEYESYLNELQNMVIDAD